MSAYYNEIDPFAAAWLRELIKAKLIADGEVDERSIADVRADDLRGFVQCHFFAGIGGWSHALRLAGWPDDRAVWTGSCPCQPFSSAGRGAGGDDTRHLWPTWFRLIRERRPIVVFGEQVESAISHGWLDLVFDDLEAADYAAASVGLAAACVGAFHGRPRLWFVADAHDARLQGRVSGELSQRASERASGPGGASGELADAGSERPDGERLLLQQRGPFADRVEVTRRGTVGGMGEPDGWRETPFGGVSKRSDAERSGSFWAGAEWLACRDGKARPVEPGTFPLATGIPARVGRLRGYGNAIVPQVAQVFIEAYMSLDGR